MVATDHLPEHEPYTDTGCDIAPRCLACPLPACRYDLPPKRAGGLMREAELMALLATGLTMGEAAVRMGATRRTVYRLKASATLGPKPSAPRPKSLPLPVIVRPDVQQEEAGDVMAAQRHPYAWTVCPACAYKSREPDVFTEAGVCRDWRACLDRQGQAALRRVEAARTAAGRDG